MDERRPGISGIYRTVEMPSRENIKEALTPLGLLGISRQTDRFFEKFMETVERTSITGSGLYLTWDLTVSDTLGDLAPVVRASVNMHFDNVMDAIIPDEEVARDAKLFRTQVLKELRKTSSQ